MHRIHLSCANGIIICFIKAIKKIIYTKAPAAVSLRGGAIIQYISFYLIKNIILGYTLILY